MTLIFNKRKSFCMHLLKMAQNKSLKFIIKNLSEKLNYSKPKTSSSRSSMLIYINETKSRKKYRIVFIKLRIVSHYILWCGVGVAAPSFIRCILKLLFSYGMWCVIPWITLTDSSSYIHLTYFFSLFSFLFSILFLLSLNLCVSLLWSFIHFTPPQITANRRQWSSILLIKALTFLLRCMLIVVRIPRLMAARLRQRILMSQAGSAGRRMIS